MKKEEVIETLNKIIKDNENAFNLYCVNINNIFISINRYEIQKNLLGDELILYYKDLFTDEMEIASIKLKDIKKIG